MHVSTEPNPDEVMLDQAQSLQLDDTQAAVPLAEEQPPAASFAGDTDELTPAELDSGADLDADQLDQEQVHDEEEQELAQDFAPTPEEAALQELAPVGVGDAPQDFLSRAVGAVPGIVQQLAPITVAQAAEAPLHAAPRQTADASVTTAQQADTDEEPSRLAEVAASLTITPEQVTKFKQENPHFATWDNAAASDALREITAMGMIQQQDADLKAAEQGHKTIYDVEPTPTSPAPATSTAELLREKALNPGGPNPILAGIIKSGLEAYDAVNEIALGNPPNPGEWRKGFENYYANLTGASSIAATLAQWGVGFVGVGKFAKLAGLAKATTKTGLVAEAAAKGAVTDFAFFDGHQQRLSNIIQDNAVTGSNLANPITEALASKPDDTEALGRAKNALEGLGLGMATDVIIHGIKSLRAAKAGDHAAAEAAADEAAKKFDELNSKPASDAADESVDAKPQPDAAAPNAEATAAPKAESSAPQVTRLDAFRLQATAKQIAGDVAENPLKRPLWTEAPAEAPTPSTFDSLTDEADLRAIVQATEDEILKGIDGSLTQANAQVISTQESQRLAQDFAQMTGADEGVFLNRMASDATSMQQLHARLLAYDQVTRSMASGIRDMARAVKDGTPGEFGTIEALHEAFETRLASYAQVQDWLKGVRSETGRALNVLKYSRMLGPQLSSIDGSAMSSLRSGKSIEDLADDVLIAGTDRGRLAKVADPTVYERSRDALVSLFIKNILSGPSTHVTNILGNTLAAVTHPAAKIIGGALHADRELMAEGVKQYGYMLTESVNAVKMAGEAYKRGHAILDTGARKLSGTPVEALEASRVGLDPESVTGRLFNAGATILDGVSTRALEASDEFFKQTIYTSEVMARSFTDGVNLGLDGDALKAYVKQQRDAAFVANERGPAVANIEGNANAAGALDTARFNTFSQDVKPSGVAATVMAATNKWPVLKFAVPFVRVVNNILSFSGALTPGLQGLSRMYTDAVARGGRDAAVAHGRLALGSAMWTSALGLAAGGYITGEGPADYQKRQQLEQTGWRAHSLRVGDSYIDLNRLDPIGLPFTMAGAMYQKWHEGEKDDWGAVQVAAAMSLALSHVIADRNFLRGFTGLFDALFDRDGQGLERFSANVVGSILVPNIVRQTMTNANDPYLHEAKGFMENVMRRVPGLSDNLAIRRMPWGEKMQLNPALYNVQKDDPLMMEYARVLETGERGAPDPLPRMKSIPGDKALDLAREVLPDGRNLYDAYGDLVMRPSPDVPPLTDVLKQLVASDDYKGMIDGPGTLNGTKLKAWRTIISRYRQAAWRQVLVTYPQVREKVYAKKMDTASRAMAVQHSIQMESYIND